VRREDAERICGHPFAAESRTSLLLKPWWHIEIMRRLRRSDFDPKPGVDSVMLWLARRPRPLVNPHEASSYERFMKKSFGTRGNTMRQCLRLSLTGRQIGQLSTFLRFSDSAPPSSLTFDQWLGLFRYSAKPVRRAMTSPFGGLRIIRKAE
jgi:23S rRNA (adenine-N6)-dimethyltransferase